MSASSKEQRSQPPNQFEDYNLTYTSGPDSGLYPIDNASMFYMNGLAGQPGAFSYTRLEGLLDIGFKFKFDNKEYDKLYVDASGWCCLIDPECSNFSLADVLYPSLSYGDERSDENQSIKAEFAYEHTLLAPWFDGLQNVYRSLDDSITGGVETYLFQYLYLIGQTVSLDNQIELKEKMRVGKIVYIPGIDDTSGGVKYYQGVSNAGEKCLVIRWKSFSDNVSYANVICFDLVLYESGVVEFRYDKKNVMARSIYEKATIGIFGYGGIEAGQNSSLRYRDFGYLCKKDDSTDRGIYTNGGAIYNGIYTEIVDSRTVRYAASLNVSDHWPGGIDNGAVFKFFPPSYRNRQTSRSITTVRDATSILRSGGSPLFNDQLTISTEGKQLIEYPSMLPVSYKLNNNLYDESSAIMNLYSSGSIRIEREFNPHLANSVFYDSMIQERNKK